MKKDKRTLFYITFSIILIFLVINKLNGYSRESPESNSTEQLKDIIYNDYAKGPIQDNYEYKVNNKWDSIIRNHRYYDYDLPHLSWKIEEVLEGLNYAYIATGDEFFLDELLLLYDELLSRRDDASGRQSWDGKIYNLWGSTSRYNGARKSIYNSEGIEVANLNFNGLHNDQILITLRNSDDYFDLIIKNKEKEYILKNLKLETFSKRVEEEIDLEYYGSPLKDNKVVKASVDYNYLDSHSDLVDIEETMPNNMVVPNVVHTGLILENMAITYKELKNNQNIDSGRYKIEIELMINDLIETTWNEINEEEGYFSDPLNSPTYLGGGKVLPWNQQFPLVSAMAIYGREENNKEYEKIVNQFSSYFRKHIEESEDGYLWKYWEETTGTIDWFESTNYGGIDVQSIYRIYKTGIAFTEKDINMISKTINNKIIKEDGTISTRIDGSGNGNIISLFRYLPYANKCPKIIDLLVEVDLDWMKAAKLLYYTSDSVLSPEFDT